MLKMRHTGPSRFHALVWTNRWMKIICSHLLYLPITHARWNGRRWTLVGSTHSKWNRSIPRLGAARHIFGRHSRPNKVLSPQMPFLKNNQLLIFCLIGRRQIDKKYNFLYCSDSEKFYCTSIVNRNSYSRSRGIVQPGCLNINQICDGQNDCATGVDEENCDAYV